jgi:hypothetical protein
LAEHSLAEIKSKPLASAAKLKFHPDSAFVASFNDFHMKYDTINCDRQAAKKLRHHRNKTAPKGEQKVPRKVLLRAN